jgi:hypothetical protein
LKDYWVKPNEVQNFHYENWYDNPYLMAYEKINTVDNNKGNAMFSVNYQILPWMKALLRSGIDLYINQSQRRAPAGINSQRFWGGTDKGYYRERSDYGYTLNNDLFLMIDKRFDKFSVEGLFGGSVYAYQTRLLQATTRNGLSIPGFYSLKASVESPDVETDRKRKQVNSLFGKMTVGYRSAFYLDLTGRNDWSSTLPSDDNSYFYPSAGGSVVMSELIKLPDWFHFWKLRSAWTVSKKDLEIYDLNQSYTVTGNVWNGLNTAVYPVYIRGNIKPITNRTWEVGTAFYLFPGNRLKVDFSYYDKLTYNNTTKVNISAMSGYEQKLVNTNEEWVRKGAELMLEAIPVQTKDFAWNAILNWSTSRIYFAKLDEQYSADNLWTYVGARTDAFTAREFNYSEEDLILYSGFPRLSDYQTRIGYQNPDWEWGLTNVFSYMNFVLSISLDGRVGGMSESGTNRRMWQTGAHPDTDNQWRYDEVVNGNKAPYLADGVKIVSGEVTYDSYGRIVSDSRTYAPNDVPVSYEGYIKGYWRNGPQLNFDETFFKLRELSLAYDVPKATVQKCRLKRLSVALVGQNLLLWTKEYKYADPDKHRDDLASPSRRYAGINLKVEF